MSCSVHASCHVQMSRWRFLEAEASNPVCCRFLRNQQYIAKVKRDIDAREAAQTEAADAFISAHPKRTLPRSRIEDFVNRSSQTLR